MGPICQCEGCVQTRLGNSGRCFKQQGTIFKPLPFKFKGSDNIVDGYFTEGTLTEQQFEEALKKENIKARGESKFSEHKRGWFKSLSKNAGIEELEETGGQGSFVVTYLVYEADHQPKINASA